MFAQLSRRVPGRFPSVEERTRIRASGMAEALQEWRWKPRCFYTELAGNSVYLLMGARLSAAPAEPGCISVGRALVPSCRRLLVTGPPNRLEPARVPRIHAETAVKQNPGCPVID